MDVCWEVWMAECVTRGCRSRSKITSTVINNFTTVDSGKGSNPQRIEYLSIFPKQDQLKAQLGVSN